MMGRITSPATFWTGAILCWHRKFGVVSPTDPAKTWSALLGNFHRIRILLPRRPPDIHGGDLHGGWLGLGSEKEEIYSWSGAPPPALWPSRRACAVESATLSALGAMWPFAKEINQIAAPFNHQRWKAHPNLFKSEMLQRAFWNRRVSLECASIGTKVYSSRITNREARICFRDRHVQSINAKFFQQKYIWTFEHSV